MPRCYSTVKKINKQPDSIQQYKKIKVGSRGNSPERAVGRKVQSYDTNNQVQHVQQSRLQKCTDRGRFVPRFVQITALNEGARRQ